MIFSEPTTFVKFNFSLVLGGGGERNKDYFSQVIRLYLLAYVEVVLHSLHSSKRMPFVGITSVVQPSRLMFKKVII